MGNRSTKESERPLVSADGNGGMQEKFAGIAQAKTRDVADIKKSIFKKKTPDTPEESPLRLKNIFAAPVDADENFERPIFVKSDSEKAAINAVLETNFVFSSLEKEDRGNLVDAFEKIIVTGGLTIITEGEVGDYFYVIGKGDVNFSIAGSKVGSAGAGSSFGDLALIYNCPRAATCVAKSTCTLWRLDQVTYRKVVANNAMANENVKRNLLKKVPFLESVDDADLNKMASAATTVKFSKGESIVQKGEIGKDFYVVQDGQVTIKDIEAGGKKFEDQTLGPGEYFGERAIVRDEPRAANVIALDNVALLSISQEVFMKVLGPLKDLVIKANDLRRLKGIPAFANSDVTESEYRTLISLMQDNIVDSDVPIVEEKSRISGAIYIIRSGTVELKSSSQDGAPRMISEGGYFGEQTMHMESYESRLSATTQKKTDLGIITYQDIKSVLQDMSRLHIGGGPSKKNYFDSSIELNDLKKHRILGVGTFGKVWLVSYEKNKKSTVYALKIQEKRQLLDNRQVEGVKREAKIMAQIDHPFIIKMISLYQDRHSIIMLLQLVPGGELYSIMKKARRKMVPEADTKFYTSGILEGLSHMHRRDIVYRDLKPENILINSDGYVVIVDMGFAKVVKDKTFTLCGTPWYIAPEVIVGKGHDKGCDYWSWAILVHEMLSGVTPFHAYGVDQMTLFKAIVQGRSRIRSVVSADARDLIERIIVSKSSLRLGCLAGGDRDIKKHKWLQDINFHELVDRKIEAPWKPAYKNALDCSEFDNWDHMKAHKRPAPLTKREQEQFKDFDNILK